MNKRWFQSKAVWTGISGVVTAVGGFVTGVLGPAEALQLGFTSVMGIFIRTGIEAAR